MANVFPLQVRAVDPYADYNSNSVNRLNQSITKGINCLLSGDNIDVIIDSTSSTDHVIVGIGQCIKDDVLIEITSDFSVDFTDSDFYLSGPAFNEAGIYYVTLDYTYVKARPAPEASIKIFKPSQRTSLTSQYLFLKAVNVIFTGSVFEIDSLSDYDQSIPNNKRTYVKSFLGMESYKPSFIPLSDSGRIIYDRETGISYIGLNDGWYEFGTFDYECDTTLCSVGQLAYIGSGNIAHPANSDSQSTFASCFVLTVGSLGKVRLNGRITGGLVETGIIITPGDTLYLSDIEDGKVTNIIPEGGIQIIGICIASSGSDYSCIMTLISGVDPNILEHNLLQDIQGGNSSERYHLDLTNYTALVAFGGNHNNCPTGLQGGSSSERYHLLQAIYDANNTFAGNHNNCPSGLQGGDVSERYHLTEDEHTSLLAFGGEHNNCTGIQGGNSSERYHLTADEYSSFLYFASGTRLLFPQSSAPTGWTQVTSYNDRVIRVTNGTGGATGGSWTISGLSSPSHAHSTGSHTLTILEMPEHSHSISPSVTSDTGSSSQGPSQLDDGSTVNSTQSEGGGQPHNHGLTDPATVAISSSGAWRPSYLDVIIASKD